MSQGNQSSLAKEVLSASQRLSGPVGQNLSNSTTRTLAPSMGAVAYDSGDDMLYYGSVDTWNSVGGVLTVGPFSTGSNASGATISSQTLTLYSADATHPGGVNTIDQTFSGVKGFNDGVIVSTLTPSSGTNVLDIFYASNIGVTTFTGALTGFTPAIAYMSIGSDNNSTRPIMCITFAPSFSVVATSTATLRTANNTVPLEYRIPGVAYRDAPFPTSNGTYVMGICRVYEDQHPSFPNAIEIAPGYDPTNPDTLATFTNGQRFSAVPTTCWFGQY